MRYVKYSNARIKICLQDFSLRFTICAQCILIWKTTKKTFVIDAIELVSSKLKPVWRAIVRFDYAVVVVVVVAMVLAAERKVLLHLRQENKAAGHSTY